LGEVSCARFVAILWSIWHAQNVYLWEHKQAVPTAICRFAMDMIRDYNWCCNLLGTMHTPIPVAVWETPGENWLKCKVHGVIFSEEEKFGIGLLVFVSVTVRVLLIKPTLWCSLS
jgi:hypothetical protein